MADALPGATAPIPSAVHAVLTGSPALGTPNLNISPGLRAFYAARGMWSGGEPKGLLSTMLGPRLGPVDSQWGTWFYVSNAQIGELMRDLAKNGPLAGMSAVQIGQAMRRMRDALKIAGEPVPMVPRATTAPGATSHGAPAAGHSRAPFRPVLVPPMGKARAATCAELVADHRLIAAAPAMLEALTGARAALAQALRTVDAALLAAIAK